MSRWAPDAAVRLERAALELFASQGYSATTVPQITARADLTTRTFFRHFTDKREVLFLRERAFPGVVAALLADAPPALTPLDLVMHGFEQVARDQFDSGRHALSIRRAIIRSDAHLRERELLKSSMLAESIRGALIEYGIDASTAGLLAPLAVLLFDTSLSDWVDGSKDRPLIEVLRSTRARMHQLIS